MIAMKFKKWFLLILCVALLIPGILQCEISSHGAESFSWTASDISSDAFTVTLKFPAVNWGSFDFTVTFDPAVVQMSKKPKVTTADEDVYDFSPTHPNISVGNGSGTFKINGVYPVGEDMTNSATTITFYFSVKSTTAEKAKISLAVSEFVRPDTSAINISAPTPVTVTLKTQSTDGGGATSSTTKPTDSVTDTKPSVTDTDTPTKTSTSTKTDTTTDKTSSKTSTKTSTKTSSKNTSSKTDTDTGTESDVTDSESLTDTETNFPISDSATGTETDLTDVTDTTDTTDPSDTDTTSVSTSVLVPQKPNEKQPPSTGMIALVSIVVALVFCGALTAIGLLRHKKED